MKPYQPSGEGEKGGGTDVHTAYHRNGTHSAGCGGNKDGAGWDG